MNEVLNSLFECSGSGADIKNALTDLRAIATEQEFGYGAYLNISKIESSH